MTKPTIDWSAFEGIDSPRYTMIPDQFFDLIAPALSEAELRVMLYVMRRTFGWKKDTDDISLSQMVNGISKKDGTIVDYGTGMAKSSVQKGIAGLVDKGLLIATANASETRGHEATTYRPRMSGESRPLGAQTAKGLYRQTAKGVPDPIPANGQALYRQTATQETVNQQTNSKRQLAIDPKEMDPVRDRAAILANRAHRPEITPAMGRNPETAAAWLQVQHEWDLRHGQRQR